MLKNIKKQSPFFRLSFYLALFVYNNIGVKLCFYSHSGIVSQTKFDFCEQLASMSELSESRRTQVSFPGPKLFGSPL